MTHLSFIEVLCYISMSSIIVTVENDFITKLTTIYVYICAVIQRKYRLSTFKNMTGVVALFLHFKLDEIKSQFSYTKHKNKECTQVLLLEYSI